MAKLIEPEILRELLSYCPETGSLTWKSRPVTMFKDSGSAKSWNTRYADTPAFTPVNGSGYLGGRIFNQTYRAHRVIWALVHGKWPTLEIDHINGVRTDNRISNLREVHRSENSKNKMTPSNNTSGQSGVSWHVGRRKWRVQISAGGKRLYLGLYRDLASAIAARDAAHARFGFHPNHGRMAAERDGREG